MKTKQKTDGISIVLTHEKSEELFYNALCNSLSYMRGYGLSLSYEKGEYAFARIVLISQGKEDICHEDVLMEILREGNSLKLIDEENDGDMTREIYMHHVWKRVQLTPIDHLVDMIEERDDATTGDVILQTVFFGDVVFG